jgi:hypothetical protein
MALPLRVFTVFVGLRPAYSKLSSAALRERLDKICFDISQQPVFRAKIRDKFFAAMTNIEIPGGYITAGRVIAPVLENHGTSFSGHVMSPCGTYTDNGGTSQNRLCVFRDNVSDLANPLKLNATEKARLGLPRYPTYASGRCDIAGSSTACTSAPSRNFFGPIGITIDADERAAGNVVVCEAAAELKAPGLLGAFPGELETVTVRVAYWAPPNNWDPRLDPDSGITNEPVDDWGRYDTKASLSVIIAPQMMTPPADVARSSANDRDYMEINNDILSTTGVSPSESFPTSTVNNYNPNAAGKNSFSENQAAIDIDTLASNETDVEDEVSLPPTSAITGDRLWEKRLACMNLPAMVRNMFVATILKLAARDGMHRLNTAVFLAGTQHQNLREGNTESSESGVPTDSSKLNNTPYFPSPPILLVPPGGSGTPPGSLLFEDDWTHPYVSYYEGARPLHLDPVTQAAETANFNAAFNAASRYRPAGVVGVSIAPGTDLETITTPAGARDVSSGWVLPFSREITASPGAYRPDLDYLGYNKATQVAQASAYNQVRLMRSAQLRDCFHMYSAGGNGIKIDYDHDVLGGDYVALNTSVAPSVAGERFEPAVTRRTYLRNSAYAAGTNWQSNCQTIPCSSDGVDAIELAKSLGTIQSCPHEYSGLPDDRFPVYNAGGPSYDYDGLTTNGRCYKNWPPTGAHLDDNATPSLRPDLVGALWALDTTLNEGNDGGTSSWSNEMVPFFGFPTTSTTADGSTGEIHENLDRAIKTRWLRSPGLSLKRRSGANNQYKLLEDGSDPDSDSSPHEVFNNSGTPLSYGTYSAAGTNEYGTVSGDDSGMILIVTHQPITENEVFELAEVIRAMNIRGNTNRTAETDANAPRGVVIAYFPTYRADLTDDVMLRFARALGLADPTASPAPAPVQGWPGSEFNALEIYSPRRQEFTDATGTNNIVYSQIASNPERELKRYWRHMLDSNPRQWSFTSGSLTVKVERNILDYAESLYYQDLHRVQPKL